MLHAFGTDKHSVAGRVVAEARAFGCGFDGASMGAVGDPVDHRDDVAADEAQVSQSPHRIAVRTDRDVVGRLTSARRGSRSRPRPRTALLAPPPGTSTETRIGRFRRIGPRTA